MQYESLAVDMDVPMGVDEVLCCRSDGSASPHSHGSCGTAPDAYDFVGSLAQFGDTDDIFWDTHMEDMSGLLSGDDDPLAAGGDELLGWDRAHACSTPQLMSCLGEGAAHECEPSPLVAVHPTPTRRACGAAQGAAADTPAADAAWIAQLEPAVAVPCPVSPAAVRAKQHAVALTARSAAAPPTAPPRRRGCCTFPGCRSTNPTHTIGVELLDYDSSWSVRDLEDAIGIHTVCKNHYNWIRRCVGLEKNQPHKTCAKLGRPSARCTATLLQWADITLPEGVRFSALSAREQHHS